MKKARIIALGILVLLVLVILFQNTEPVTATLLFWKMEAPAVVVFSGMFLSGAIVGAGGVLLYGKRRKQS